MKKLLVLIPTILLLASCSKGVEPQDPIGLAAGFAYCATLAGYWGWGIIITAIVGAGLYFYFQKAERINPWVVFAGLVLISLAWLYAPSEVAWNTTVEQAAKGVYIR